MMVQRSQIENLPQFLKEVDHVAAKLKEITQKEQVVSKKELNDLINVLENCNVAFDAKVLEEKKFAPEKMQTSIENALAAIQLFQRNQSTSGRAGQRNVEQAIAALVSTLSEEIDKFGKNLKNLKEYKIGRRVEKTEKSKDTSK